ncbi:MAG: diguanylate cyclase [Steroidobacteraceae bacterium]
MIKGIEELTREGRLPSPHGVAQQLMQLASREDVSAGELARTLQADPVLSGRLLRIANSAAASQGRPVVSIGDAVVRIGFRSVRQLAVGFSLIEQHGEGACAAFDYAGFWSRSLATAVAAEQIARRLRVVAPDECFTLGLLLDVGSLAAATLYPREFERLAAEVGAPGSPSWRAAEAGAFGFTTGDLTDSMLEDWGIPELLRSGVRQREMASAAADKRTATLAALLACAERIGHWCVARGERQAAPAAELVRALETLGIPGDDIDELVRDIGRDWAMWGQMLRVATQPVASPLEAARRAATAETVTASEPARPDASPEPRPLRVLVVEDADSQRITLCRVLESMGFETSGAKDGLQALASIERDAPEIICTDIVMPGMDGIALCRAVRAAERGQAPYIVVLTANTNADSLVRAFEAGADDFLTKPVNRRELEARMRSARRVAELHRRLEREAAALRQSHSQLENLNRQLASAALTDSLTGLPNRRHILDRLKQEWALAQRRDQPLAVIFLDIDHFKRINDERGHEAGDIVLERLARILRRTVRVEDTVGRFGGEEFIVLCPATTATGAARIAERVREQVAVETFTFDGTSFRITASLGVAAVSPAAGADWNEALRRADLALYSAKKSGRNQVRT